MKISDATIQRLKAASPEHQLMVSKILAQRKKACAALGFQLGYAEQERCIIEVLEVSIDTYKEIANETTLPPYEPVKKYLQYVSPTDL